MGTYHYSGGERPLREHLERRTDPKAARMRWMLGLPDLSRQPRSPVHHLVRRVLGVPCLASADLVTVPEIVSVERNFDLLNAPLDHPSRRPSDTYYADARHVLRTQTTCMWTWYLGDERVRRRLLAEGEVTAVSYGKVFRNDEIDRSHYPVFHQIDAICVAARAQRTFDRTAVDRLLLEVAHAIFGADVETRILDDSFPFTEQSRQLEVRWKSGWLELVGAGLVHPEVLTGLGLDPAVLNGWAFGFGLDRLAMRKLDIPDIRILWSDDERIRRQLDSIDARFTPVSKYPATTRDVSFVVNAGLPLNDFHEIVREHGIHRGEGIVEEVELVDRYENAEKLGAGRVSHTFRIRYRSFLRTLTNDEINAVQAGIRDAVQQELGAELR